LYEVKYGYIRQVILLVKKIVIDACVAIDLNIPKVNFLKEVLFCCNDDKILISSINYNEIRNYNIQQLLQKSDNVDIIEDDENDFVDFSNELKTLKLNLSSKDMHVLYLANKSNADFIVSSDLNVYDKASKFKKIKNLNYINPMTTVTLLAYIYEQGKIGYSVFLEKTLCLYKYKEIDNMLKHLSDDLNVSKPPQMEIIGDFNQSMKERFQGYEAPLIMEYKYLLNLGRLPT
jgi:hypothetical protein